MSSQPEAVARGRSAAGGRPEDERLSFAATLGYGLQHILAQCSAASSPSPSSSVERPG
jgi:hypothetical protein